MDVAQNILPKKGIFFQQKPNSDFRSIFVNHHPSRSNVKSSVSSAVPPRSLPYLWVGRTCFTLSNASAASTTAFVGAAVDVSGVDRGGAWTAGVPWPKQGMVRWGKECHSHPQQITINISYRNATRAHKKTTPALKKTTQTWCHVKTAQIFFFVFRFRFQMWFTDRNLRARRL